MMTSGKLKQISSDGGLVEQKSRVEWIRDNDTIVLALGVTPENELALMIENEVPEIHVIGDARTPGKALDAIAAGARVGRMV